MRAYPIDIQQDDKTKVFVVSFPDVPGVTQGDTYEEAMLRAVDALETALSTSVDRNEPFPKPSRPARGQVTIRLSALGEAKAALYEGMRKQRIGRAELARRLGWHLAQVSRVLDLCHESRMEAVEAALRAIGLRLEVDVKAA